MLKPVIPVIITEGVAGTWFYHLSDPLKFTRGFCGAQVMKTAMTLEQWGTVGHLRERYCKECERIAGSVPVSENKQ